MLNQKQVLEFAIKGVGYDISKLERSIKRGKILLQHKEKRIARSSKTTAEIEQTIQDKKAEIEKLIEYQNELKWQLAELDF